MIYPTISEYIESIKYAEENFATLTNLQPVMTEDGYPVMSSGNFSVVFKMRNEFDGKLYAIKCFTREQDGREQAYQLISEELTKIESPFFIKTQYQNKELYVVSKANNGFEFPVVVMEWIDGTPLDKYVHDKVTNNQSLELLICRFIRLAKWLISSPFSHGDIKPDNLLVKGDGNIVVVDYDGMYVPSMKGQRARELGSQDFRHPQWSFYDFDARIDDFSLSSILLSLIAIEYDNELYEKYHAKDRLLLSERDYYNLHDSGFLKEISLSDNADLNIALSFFLLAYSRVDLSRCVDILDKIEDRFFQKFETYCHGPVKTEAFRYSLFGPKYKNVIKDQERAFNNFIVLGQMGNKDAQCCIGCCYRGGKGVERDIDKSIFWYLKAINNDDTRAINHLNNFIIDLFKEKDYAKALNLVEYVQNYGEVNEDVSIMAAFCYEYGWGTTKDSDSASKWFQRISSSRSVNYVAKTYYSGKYLHKEFVPNIDKSIIWLRKGVLLKNMECIVQLWQLLEEGTSIELSADESKQLYEIAKSDFWGMCLLFKLCAFEDKSIHLNELIPLILKEIKKVENKKWSMLKHSVVKCIHLLEDLIDDDQFLNHDYITNNPDFREIIRIINTIHNEE